MTDERDAQGNLLPDEKRMTDFGRRLRASSFDEWPELFNILKGEMSIVGPRPQLVRDMVFFTEEEMHRQDVTPGLTGLAQISGRNAIDWKEKFRYDLQYIQNISFLTDLRIIYRTVFKVNAAEDITAAGMETAEDYGDWLLKHGIVSKDAYLTGQENAKQLIEAYTREKNAAKRLGIL